MARKVDDAMAAERPEKQTVRDLWVAEVRAADTASPVDAVPLYLTMPGELGGDIQALVEDGVVELTETGAIVDAEQKRVVAVESSPQAVIALQRRFPGLKILQQPLHSLLHSTRLTAWPQGEHKQYFRAQVINLDLNCALAAEIANGQLTFPILALVRKIATLHADDPYIEWTLCLTLHGEVSWDNDSQRQTCEFLAANFDANQGFSDNARALLGEGLHSQICERGGNAALATLSSADQQRVLMVLVPKRIAFDAHREGWSVETVENLRYGGSAQRAPMVTWILRFRWDPRAGSQPDLVYHEALEAALVRRGCITTTGRIERV